MKVATHLSIYIFKWVKNYTTYDINLIILKINNNNGMLDSFC